MTDERKNEIWAMLTQEEKDGLVKYITNNANTSYCKGCNDVFEMLFGKHNLTAQAEEKLLFKSEYKAGDKVVITGSLCESRGKAITLVRHYDCPRETNDYQKLWVGQFEDGHTCSIAEKDFTPTVEFEQAEEKPKKGLLDRIIDTGYNFLDRHNHDVISERGTSNIDYTNYRLDLAKEIAVAMIRNTYVADEIVENVATAANLANEIVKRLKETEI